MTTAHDAFEEVHNFLRKGPIAGGQNIVYYRINPINKTEETKHQKLNQIFFWF